MVDLPKGDPECDGLRVSLQHGLEEAGVGEIGLNLAPMVLQRYARQEADCGLAYGAVRGGGTGDMCRPRMLFR